jgi:hypothetical protein
LVIGASAPHALAHRPANPIDITGVIKSFDKANQTFTVQTDKPAKLLKIAIGRDCKFKHDGVDAGDQILKPGAHVDINYFATIFTGNVAVTIELIGCETR